MKQLVAFLVGLLLPVVVVYGLLLRESRYIHPTPADQLDLQRYLEGLPGD